MRCINKLYLYLCCSLDTVRRRFDRHLRSLHAQDSKYSKVFIRRCADINHTNQRNNVNTKYFLMCTCPETLVRPFGRYRKTHQRIFVSRVTRRIMVSKYDNKKSMPIQWICYERSFSEFYLSIRNQLVFNQRLQLFVQSSQPYLLIFAWRN